MAVGPAEPSMLRRTSTAVWRQYPANFVPKKNSNNPCRKKGPLAKSFEARRVTDIGDRCARLTSGQSRSGPTEQRARALRSLCRLRTGTPPKRATKRSSSSKGGSAGRLNAVQAVVTNDGPVQKPCLGFLEPGGRPTDPGPGMASALTGTAVSAGARVDAMRCDAGGGIQGCAHWASSWSGSADISDCGVQRVREGERESVCAPRKGTLAW